MLYTLLTLFPVSFLHYFLSLLLPFFFNDTATTEIYTLSLHDALPISRENPLIYEVSITDTDGLVLASSDDTLLGRDRKSTRLNSSHEWISYAVFCLKKKKKTYHSGGTLSSEVKVSIC